LVLDLCLGKVRLLFGLVLGLMLTKNGFLGVF